MTSLVVMVTEACHLVEHAHITLLAPFGAATGPTAAELEEVEQFFAGQPDFPFALTGEAVFPGGKRYLVPEPRQRFSRLTHGLHRLFPHYSPHRASVDLVVPHLSIPPRVAVPDLSVHPIHAYAAEVTLVRREEGVLIPLQAFSLGTSAA